MSRRLAVVEAEWWNGYSHTVKPFFEGLFFNLMRQRDGFYYERFVGPDSFAEVLQHLARKRDVRILYIASHGSSASLGCPNGDEISRRHLAKLLQMANSETRLDGLYFGSCLVGNQATAKALLSSEQSAHQRVKWVAGYEKSVDWLESTLLDVFFLKHVLGAEMEGLTPNKAVLRACNEILYKAEGFAYEMGFHLYVRQKKTGSIVDLYDVKAEDREQYMAELDSADG